MLWWILASFKGQLTIWHGFEGPKRTAGREGRDFARERVVDLGLAVILDVKQVDETLGNFTIVLRLQGTGLVADWRVRMRWHDGRSR
jgi:hypothetical protein